MALNNPVPFKLCHVSLRVRSGQRRLFFFFFPLFFFLLSVKAESIVPHAAEPCYCCQRPFLSRMLRGACFSAKGRVVRADLHPLPSKSAALSTSVVVSITWFASSSSRCGDASDAWLPRELREKVLPRDNYGKIFFPNSRLLVIGLGPLQGAVIK